MKRFCIFLLVLVLISSVAVADNITFRNIPWGSPATLVESMVRADGINFSLFDPSMCAVIGAAGFISGKYMDWTSGTGITTFSSDINPNIDVAGYAPTGLEMYFVYRPVDGRLVYEDRYTSLYAGLYTFSAENVEKMFDDLKDKLTSVYGSCQHEGGEDILEDLFGKSGVLFQSPDPVETFAILETDSAFLALASHDLPDNLDSSIYGDSISIAYVSKDGDTWIKEAFAAKDAEDAEKESEKYGNGNVNGL